MDTDSRMELVSRGAQEIVTDGELRILLDEKERPTAYVGYEPSGFVHIGWLIITKKIEELIKAGFEVTVLLADWHAFINDKFGGDLGKIQDCGHYFIDCYRAYGLGEAIDKGDLKFRWASDLADNAKYWEKVLRVSKSSSLSRIKRAMTIMGRKEGEGDLDTSKFIYPAMQASDIFELEVDLAMGGMDQRHAHMLARDVAEKIGYKKPTALHTPLLPSLSRTGRMEMVTGATGGTDHDKMADRIEEDLQYLIENGTLSPPTRAIITGLRDMRPDKRHKAIEVLLAGKRRVGGKAPIYSILHKGENEEALINNREHKEMDRQLNMARRELYNYLGITEDDEDFDMKMSKSDPDSGRL
ncbi:MAG: tyrosine--tRNA ligase [Thermoplasmatota archaeon]